VVWVGGFHDLFSSFLFKDEAMFSLTGANGRGVTNCADVARCGVTTFGGGRAAGRAPALGHCSHPGPRPEAVIVRGTAPRPRTARDSKLTGRHGGSGRALGRAPRAGSEIPRKLAQSGGAPNAPPGPPAPGQPQPEQGARTPPLH